jgi:membrane-bound lytic murein transglycosylase B
VKTGPLVWGLMTVCALGLGAVTMGAVGLWSVRETASAQDGDAASGSELVEPRASRVDSADEGLEPEDEPGAAGIAELVSAPWVSQTANRLGIPERALAAYAGAAARLADEQPGCGVDWTTLAGIGHVESGHGTLDGGSIDASGAQTPAIYGIALNGTVTDAIHDTDGGVLDRDPVWDRAVGPMQIIPETWEQYAADGNGDGKADPQQIDDAALTAARYLCAVGVDLRTSDGWISAIAAYNDTVDYNNLVAEATSYYRVG